MPNRRECFSIMSIENEACDFILFRRNKRFFQKTRQGDIGQFLLRPDAFFLGLSGEAGELITRAQRRGRSQQFFEVGTGAHGPTPTNTHDYRLPRENSGYPVSDGGASGSVLRPVRLGPFFEGVGAKKVRTDPAPVFFLPSLIHYK